MQKVIDENEMVYINVYFVTREYGGSEEGGWWYNWYNCIECVPVRRKRTTKMKEVLEEEYKIYKAGDIYSVLGGRDVKVLIELERAKSETKERPHYE